jgi:hypothetical protein
VQADARLAGSILRNEAGGPRQQEERQVVLVIPSALDGLPRTLAEPWAVLDLCLTVRDRLDASVVFRADTS